MVVILNIDEAYADVMTISLVGTKNDSVNITTCGVDLSKYNYVNVDKRGNTILKHLEG